jgi:probable phosphoglycerate mutase
MKEINAPIDDPKFKKLFDIDQKYYEESSFLRSIKGNYLRFGSLSERQIETFKRVSEEMKNPELLKEKIIYLVRHGESTTNVTHRLTNPAAELTEKGKEQVFANASYLEDKDIHAMYCSTLKRAVDTATLIGQVLQRKPMRTAAIKDTNTGKLAGKSFDDEDVVKALKIHKEDIEGTEKNEIESFGAVQERIKPFVEKVLGSRWRHIVIVSHLDITRVLLSLLLKKPMEDFVSVKQPNDCVYVVDMAKGEVKHFYKKKETSGLLQ